MYKVGKLKFFGKLLKIAASASIWDVLTSDNIKYFLSDNYIPTFTNNKFIEISPRIPKFNITEKLHGASCKMCTKLCCNAGNYIGT